MYAGHIHTLTQRWARKATLSLPDITNIFLGLYYFMIFAIFESAH